MAMTGTTGPRWRDIEQRLAVLVAIEREFDNE
jgi:hypothetical protein